MSEAPQGVETPPILTDDDAAILDAAISPDATPPGLDELPFVRYSRARVPLIPAIQRLTTRTMILRRGIPYLIVQADPWRQKVHVDVLSNESDSPVVYGPTSTSVSEGYTSEGAGVFYSAYSDLDLPYNGELWISSRVDDLTISYYTLSTPPKDS